MPRDIALEITDESRLYLMLASPERINAMNSAIIQAILSKGCTPVVVTVNRPYRVLMKTYAKEGIPPDAVWVIDAVTQYSGGTCDEHPHVRYVNNPANLTDLGIAVTELVKQIPGTKRCIVFDSVNMLLIHIPSVPAAKFLHFIVNKLKLSDISGIFMSVEKGLDPIILSQLTTFVDTIIDYEKEPAPA